MLSVAGGKVGCTQALTDCEDDAGLATVIGHEWVTRCTSLRFADESGHVSQGWKSGRRYGSLFTIRAIQDTFMSLYGIGSKVAVELPTAVSRNPRPTTSASFIWHGPATTQRAWHFGKRFAAYNQQQAAAPPAFLNS